MASGVVRLAPFHYIHVCDNNSGITKVESGPQTFTRQEHETIVFGPAQMVIIPPRHYAVVSNPVARANGLPVHDANGNLKLRHGDEEIRFEQQPFPLFPGEKLVGKVTPLQVVAADAALRLRALRDFVDGKTHRNAGDEWLFYGPATYLPRVEVTVVEVIQALIIKPNQAVKFRARKEFTDRKGVTRKAGELWLIREEGAYLADVDEEYVERVNSITLTEKKALHLRARRTFTDVYGKERRAGEEWLVRLEDAETHIPDVHEELVAEVSLTTLNSRQFCVVLDPVINGKQQFGQRQLRKGPTCFFLMPGERLEQGIQDVHVLAADEALLLTAKESFVDGKVSRKPGDRWMIYGPCDYVPPIQVEVIELRSAIPLDSGEGVYVRDITSGKVTSVIGRSYMLNPNEELWEKDLPAIVEELLSKQAADDKPRDRTRVVAYRAPHNSAVQIYDYKEKKSRVVFGPDLVLLGPDEHFTVLSLSGDKPKRPHVIKALALLLGPDFSTDIVNVETADHARLALKLSYNWHFDVGAKTEEDGVRLFQVPDFVGDACKAIASRVRGAVATSSFDQFHKNSARIIRSSVFGVDEKGKIKNRFFFSANNLVITNIDIQSVQPVDQRTTDALQKSVQLAIEITTKSQEATARHEAERIEQEAKGRLERQKIFDEAKAEKERTLLLQLQANSAFVETTGHAAAEAKAKAEAAQIEGSAAVKQAEFKAQSTQIMAEVELMQMRESQKLEVEHQRLLNELEVMKAKELALIESQKFEQAVSVIGSDTIEAIAAAGPETQAKLLKGLGLSSFLITDGKSPVNLFNTASGLIGAAPFN